MSAQSTPEIDKRVTEILDNIEVRDFSGGINLPEPPALSTEALIADLYARTDALVDRLASVAVSLVVLRDQIENTRWARFKRWFRANVYSGTAAPEIERSL